MRPPRRVLATVATALVIAFAVGACSGSDGASSGGGDGGGGGSDQSGLSTSVSTLRGPSRADKAVESNSGGAPSALPARLPTIGPSVIKTAEVAVEVPRGDFRDSVQSLHSVARRYAGFVLETTIRGDNAKQGTLVVRIPADDFEQALVDVENLGDVGRENVSGQDVGQEFVDLRARLRNFTAQEAILLQLMERAESVVDTIRVQGELQGVQLEIEQLKGRLRYLDDQTRFGTITAFIDEAGAIPDKAGVIERAWLRARQTTVGIVAAIIVGAGAALPVAVLLLVVLLVVRQVRPRLTSSS